MKSEPLHRPRRQARIARQVALIHGLFRNELQRLVGPMPDPSVERALTVLTARIVTDLQRRHQLKDEHGS